MTQEIEKHEQYQGDVSSRSCLGERHFDGVVVPHRKKFARGKIARPFD
jgi:hypothetical protein